ncbi:hypothetical protein V2N95_10480 [Streptococcus pneumoniae]|nr:hypothetical protein [Streptococcus pneumoniae]HEU3614074.1 hypothetical protein [Streptococcus pneumoniae]
MGDIVYLTETTTGEPCNLLEYTFENGVVVGFGTVAGEEIGYIIPSERFELSDEDVRVGLDFIRGLTGREVVENGQNGHIRNYLLGDTNAKAKR